MSYSRVLEEPLGLRGEHLAQPKASQGVLNSVPCFLNPCAIAPSLADVAVDAFAGRAAR